MRRYSICEEGRGLNWQLRVIMEMCSESGYGVIDGVGGRPESELEKVVEKGVPLQGGSGCRLGIGSSGMGDNLMTLKTRCSQLMEGGS